MSADPVEAGRGRLPSRQWLAAVVAVLVARVLSHASPRHLSAVLRLARGGARPASYQEASAARKAVVRVSRRCAGAGCLPRSIAAALLCRFRGVWPSWQVGVLTSPLAAHAWIEAEGRPVDEPQGADRFRPLMTVGPLP